MRPRESVLFCQHAIVPAEAYLNNYGSSCIIYNIIQCNAMSGRLFSVEIIKSEKRAGDDNKANSITPATTKVSVQPFC